MEYTAPLKDILFTVKYVAALNRVQQLPNCEEATEETVQAILEENARFCGEVIAPLNWSGDQNHGSWKDGQVLTSPGFKEAYQAYVQAGWQGLQHDTAYGGQGLPKLLATPCIEMLNAANMSFALCPLLTDGAIEALSLAGNAEQKKTYLTKLISGQWAGTMNLTEPQAGSDLSMVRTRAVPQDDGGYRIFGQKIFITYGEHDLTDNIVHLVLARTPNAPEGVKGISLFVVPKFLVNVDGSLGARNDVYCASIEHKLGIKASPTAVLVYGDNKGEVGAGAIGTLVGEENRGLEYMFIMMNAARFAVGMQGIAIADRAYQKAWQYAQERLQSRDLNGSDGPVAIVNHPDVRRMLLSMKAQIEAARSLAYSAAAMSDVAEHHPDEGVRSSEKACYEFLVPIVKGWSTEMSLDVTSTAVQVFGGMGFIEETGVAQYYRDARILTIYEGTTAIQANDLVGRKTARDQGASAKLLLTQVADTLAELAKQDDDHLQAIHQMLIVAVDAFAKTIHHVVIHFKTDTKAVFAGSVPYLKMAGITLGGWQLAKAALIAKAQLQKLDPELDATFCQNKISTARFFADHFLSQVPGLQHVVTSGSVATLSAAVDVL